MSKKQSGDDLSASSKRPDDDAAAERAVEAVFARRLRVLRRVLGISASKLDHRVGFGPGTVGRLERGKQRIYASHLYRIGEITGVGVDYFYMGLDCPKQETEPKTGSEIQGIKADINYLLNSPGAAKADGLKVGDLRDDTKIVAKILTAELAGEPGTEEE